MIQFQISAPASSSLFGEHTNNILRTSIDLRTTLNFQELNFSNNIEINFPQINLFHEIPLQEFLNLYDNCVKNMEKLHRCLFIFTSPYTKHDQRFLQIFYHLLVCIMYEQQIASSEIKTFRIDLSIKSMHEEFFCLASVKVCLAACLLHWTRLQKNIQNTFDDTDLKKICTYATRCENTVSELNIIDIKVCTYGSMIHYDKKEDIHKELYLPRMMILLVDSKQPQDVEARNKKMKELKSVLPDITYSILNIIDIITKTAANIFQETFDIYKNNELSIEMKNDCLLQQHRILEVSRNINSKKKCCYVVYLCIFCVIFFMNFI